MCCVNENTVNKYIAAIKMDMYVYFKKYLGVCYRTFYKIPSIYMYKLFFFSFFILCACVLNKPATTARNLQYEFYDVSTTRKRLYDGVFIKNVYFPVVLSCTVCTHPKVKNSLISICMLSKISTTWFR